jgi:hypothetical protein
VINRTEDGHESLSEEHFELNPNKLCVGIETKDEKARGGELMASLREEARKTRAK